MTPLDSVLAEIYLSYTCQNCKVGTATHRLLIDIEGQRLREEPTFLPSSPTTVKNSCAKGENTSL
jgi:hypothetical protein